MSLSISIHEDISIDDLIGIHKKGGVVLKTPHVGNIYPNNLAIASLGIPTLFYDRNLGRKDINFHPHQLIVDSQSEVIANPDVLVTHAVVNRVPDNMPSAPPIGTRLVDFHMSAVKKSLPGAKCFTYTEYIQENAGVTLEVLKIATNQNVSLWARKVDSDGAVSRAVASSWEEIKKDGIYGLTNQQSGWLIPNPMSILLHNTIDVAKNGSDELYLLSGPDMYKYISGYQETLSSMFEEIRSRSSLKLPDNIVCHVVPVIDMRFIVEKPHMEALNELVGSYENLLARASGDVTQIDLQTTEEVMKCLGINIDVFKKTIFYDIENACCFTQHDLLKSSGLYIHPWALNSRLGDVSNAFSFLKRQYLLVRDKLQEEL